MELRQILHLLLEEHFSGLSSHLRERLGFNRLSPLPNKPYSPVLKPWLLCSFGRSLFEELKKSRELQQVADALQILKLRKLLEVACGRAVSTFASETLQFQRFRPQIALQATYKRQ